jgi:CheY-like chemotaxis protein
MTRVLVVDDDPSVCDVIERLLASSGYAVTTATTGRAALEAATHQPFAAAFVDLCMPNMHGLEIIDGLRSLAPDTKLIVMSGLMADCGGPPAPDFLGMVPNMKGIDRLSKPFGRQELLNLLPDGYIRPAAGEGEPGAN